MTDDNAMDKRRPSPSWAGRRGPLLMEIAALFLALALDVVFIARAGGPRGYVAAVTSEMISGLGTVVALLAVLRRRLPDSNGILAGCVVGLSLLGTAMVSVAAAFHQRPSPLPNAAETVAIVLLVGAVCRRLAPRPALAVAVVGGIAVVAAPVLRDGPTSVWALLAAPAALLWGGALAVGLTLRDADRRHRTALAIARERVRTAERMLMARELHDLVAHHMTGVVVRAQAAEVITARQGVDSTDTAAVFAEIAQAGTDALAATRRLIGVLRTGSETLFSPPEGIVDAIDRAVPDGMNVAIDLAAGLGDVALPPEVTSTVHRVIMEALTNVRRHAPAARDIRLEAGEQDGWLTVEVTNDAAPGPSGSDHEGYGLIGMTERATALGGSLDAGRASGGRWRVCARIPLVS